jgi:hypothetical protein
LYENVHRRWNLREGWWRKALKILATRPAITKILATRPAITKILHSGQVGLFFILDHSKLSKNKIK